MHRRKILHRDLKLGNILYAEGGENVDYPYNLTLTIADLGLARESTVNATHNVGTGVTMAPEVTKDKYDEKCDVYSLGSMFLKMITGRYVAEWKTKDKEHLELYPDGSIDVSSYGLSMFTCFVLEGCLQYNPANRMHWEYLYALLDVDNLYKAYRLLSIAPYAVTDGNKKIYFVKFSRAGMIKQKDFTDILVGDQHLKYDLQKFIGVNENAYLKK